MRSNILGWCNKQKHTNSYKEIRLRKHTQNIPFAYSLRCTQSLHNQFTAKFSDGNADFLCCEAPKTTLLWCDSFPHLFWLIFRKYIDYFCVMHDTGNGLFAQSKGHPDLETHKHLKCSDYLSNKILELQKNQCITAPKCWWCCLFLPMIWTDMCQYIMRCGLLIAHQLSHIVRTCFIEFVCN